MALKRNPNRRPTHPGEILREDIIEANALKIGEVAEALGVTRQTVSHLMHEVKGVTPLMAIRLGKVFDTTPEFWLNMQSAVDLFEAQQNPEVKRLHPLQWPRDDEQTARAAAG